MSHGELKYLGVAEPAAKRSRAPWGRFTVGKRPGRYPGHVILTGLTLAVLLAGCAAPSGVRSVNPPMVPRTIVPTEPGMFHSVARGETLWRISRNYQVPLSDLASINRITDVHSLEVGQKLFIPNRLRPSRSSAQSAAPMAGPREFIWPSRGTVVRYFNQKQLETNNRGIDIKVKTGAPVHAVADGKVIFTSDNMRGYGGTVILEHGAAFTSVYAYNQAILVKSGDMVKQGQQIGTAGSCGRSSDCIVHFELRKNNTPQNPLFYLP